MPNKRHTYLITSSILDSFNWFNECPPSWRDRAFSSIVSTVRREPYKPHKTADRGNKFEDLVFAKANGRNNEGSEHFRAVAERCRGGKFQKVIKRSIAGPKDREIILYGKIDAVFPEKLLDIKTTENYRGADKYLNNWQHVLYTFCSGIQDFTYLVVLFEEYPSMQIKEVYDIDYFVEDPEAQGKEILRGISDFHDWLEEENLFHDYEMTYSKNRRK